MIYFHHPDHRNRAYGKSQWTIPKAEELRVFTDAHAKGWMDNFVGWGLYLIQNKPDWLGLAADLTTRLFVAKFVSSKQPIQWHGYPSNNRNGAREIPSERVLESWLHAGYLRPAKIRKLERGQPCSL